MPKPHEPNPTHKDIEGADIESADETNPSIIKSLWFKHKTWERLNILKNGFNLTWNEFFEMLIQHMEQSGAVTEECLDQLKKAPKEELENTFQRNALELGLPWWKSAQHIQQLSEETIRLNSNMENLLDCIEEHTEALLDLKEP